MTDLERSGFMSMIEQKDKLIGQQSKQLDELTELVKKLNATIEELQQTIRDLQEQLGQNSSNSSRPPSSDGYSKPAPRSLKTPSGKKPGAQKGHKGNNMKLPHDPDKTEQHTPLKCRTCPGLASCIRNNVFRCAEKRYTVDAVVTTFVVEHQRMDAVCPCGQEALKGVFPDNVKAYIQYGDSVSVLSGLLNTYGAMSVERIRVFLSHLLNIDLSTGTIVSMTKQCADTVKPCIEKIRQFLHESPVVCCDETGVRVSGKLQWIHNSSNDRYTYQTVDPKRGEQGIRRNGVLEGYSGTAIHDCFSPYWKFKDARHGLCCAHLLRELIGIEENHPDHTWAKIFREYLLSMKSSREKALSEDKTALEPKELHRYEREYDLIMALAEKECPCPARTGRKKRGRWKKGKERSLIERLIKYKASVCLFAYDFAVPFDNNQAERDLRGVKSKQKISGCFRTHEGAQIYLDIMSYLSTGLKHGVNVFDALLAAFDGNSDIVLETF